MLNSLDVFAKDNDDTITGIATGKTAKTWTSIGVRHDIGDYRYGFRGNFDGGNKTVFGIYINTIYAEQGLFGYVYKGTITNVGVEASYIKGSSFVGGVVGYSHNGSISDSYNSGTVLGDDSVGGVTGQSSADGSDALVSNCYNSGTVKGDSSVGGVVGGNLDGTVTGSHNIGTVSGDEIVGGVAGYNSGYGKVTSSYNTGTVFGTEVIGGIVGWNPFGGTVTSSYNTGTISGTGDYIGGIIGDSDGLVADSNNSGKVSGINYVGGVAGNNKYGKVADSHNSGSVSGVGKFVGGVAGYNLDGEVLDSYNSGTVTGEYELVGGVVGINAADKYDAIVSNCYNSGTVKGDSSVGGVVGGNLDGIVKLSYNIGTVSGDEIVGGVAGYNGIDGILANSYNSGTVSGREAIGGLVGWNPYGIVFDSYNSGSVTGQMYIGGLIGENYGIVTSSYSIGTVSGDDFLGGVTGYNSNDGMIINSYYLDTSVVGRTNTLGTSLTSAQMLNRESYNGFDDVAWMIDVHANYPYPILRANPHFTVETNVPVSGITLNDNEIKLYVGESETLIAKVLPENATNKNVTWISNDASIATVVNGEIKAHKAGEVTITVTTVNGGIKAECRVIINEPKLETDVYIIDSEGYVMDVAPETRIGSFIANFENAENVRVTVDGKELDREDFVPTGAKVELLVGGKILDSLYVVVMGDVNGDGKISAIDARRALRHSAKLESLSGAYAKAADVNGDDNISAVDARTILRVSASLMEMPALPKNK